MIKKIIAIADLHIPNFRGIDDYSDNLNLLINSIKEEIQGIDYDDIRILILGDLIHNKNTISNELIYLTSSFILDLEKIGKVIAIAGNHDLALTNKGRIDTISTIFNISKFNNSTLLDMALNYESGCFMDENIIWALYSIYNDYAPINLEDIRNDYSDKKIIGLFHGNLIGSKLSNGIISENGISCDLFNGCDMVLCGDIHKRQVLKHNGIEIIYSGSFIQQNFGESITQHGYTVLDVDDNNNISYNFKDLDFENTYCAIEINDIDDLDNNKEILLNL